MLDKRSLINGIDNVWREELDYRIIFGKRG